MGTTASKVIPVQDKYIHAEIAIPSDSASFQTTSKQYDRAVKDSGLTIPSTSVSASIPITTVNQDASASSTATTKVIPFPKEGVKLCTFLEFIELNGGKSAFQDLTTTDVCNNFLKPNTETAKSSYCELLRNNNSENVGKATVFVSHAWRYKFLDVVEALQNHFKDSPDQFIWFDLFSNNQHLAGNLPFEWWTETFKSAIKEFGCTVMILSPWHDPIPFTRAWCLFEIYSTVVTGSQFEVAMSETERKNFLSTIPYDYGSFYKMLSTIDVEKSEAWNPDDRARIFEVAQKEVGFHELNIMVKGRCVNGLI